MKRFFKALAILFACFTSAALVVLFLSTKGIVGPSSVPAAIIEISVDRSSSQLEGAFSLPVASTYDRPTYWQSNGSFCGPASLVNVFRSFGETAEDEATVLRGTGKCSIGLCWAGLTLDELADIARIRAGYSATVLRDLNLDQFREQLRLSNEPTRRVIVNFLRRPIFGSGGGHHSPIAGYLEEQDLVLVLDVNADYGPWLVSADRLFAAVDTLDGEQKRGLLVIEK